MSNFSFKAAWWNEEVGKLRREVKVYLSCFCKNYIAENFSLPIDARGGLSRLARRLKRKEWANFCEEANNPSGSPDKIFQGNENKALGLVNDSKNEYCAPGYPFSR